MNITNFEPSHKAKLKIITTKYIYLRKHRPRKSICFRAPRPDGWRPNYESLPYNTEKLNEAFEKLVSWCINGKTDMLNNALQTPIFSKLVRLKFECVDSKTGHNIVEFAAISGKTEIMKILLKHRTDLEDYLDIGKSLKYAIAQEDVEMVKCMLDFSKNERIGYGSKGYGSLNDLCFAIEMNKIKIVEVFLEYSKPETDWAIFHFTDVLYVDHYGQVSHKDDERDNEFYDNFFDIHGIKNEIPINALLLASKLGRTELLLLKKL